MNTNYKRWKKLFLACLGLAAGTAFCMKWIEGDLWQNGEKFTIIGLELSYGVDKMNSILSGLTTPVKTILRYHLHFDFAYMVGVFPGIAALCMMAREKVNRRILRNILFTLAALQTLAWGCDVFENLQLLQWIDRPVTASSLNTFHIVVWTKWVIAILGILIGLIFVFKKRPQRFAE